MIENNTYPVVLFDDLCVICSTTTQILIKLDRKSILRFASIESEFAEKLFKVKPHLEEYDTIIFYKNGKSFLKSEAVIEILNTIFNKNIFTVFRIIPLRLRDFLYDFIAKNRYKIFRKKTSCGIIPKEQKKLFLK